MPSNTNLTIDMITKEAMRIAHEVPTFVKSTELQYDEEFGKAGRKIGNALRIRRPVKYSVTEGQRVIDVQDSEEKNETLTVATQDHVAMRFNSAELWGDLNDISRTHIRPAVTQLLSHIDYKYITAMTKKTYNTVGTPGTVVGTVTSGFSDTTALGLARAKLNQYLAPKDKMRAVQMDSITMASITNGIKNLFMPESEVKRAWVDGFIGQTQMATFYENERTWTVADPADITGEIDESTETNFTEGTTVVHMDGFTTASNLIPGMVFTWEGLYACHPETKQAYAHLQDFVIISIANPSSGDVDVTFSPPIYTTGPYKNVVTATGGAVTWTSTGQDGKDITARGSTSTSYRQNLMYHKEAYAIVFADLPIMGDAAMCKTMQQDGISLRVWQFSDGRNDELITRIDALYGYEAIRPEWGVRITN